MVYPVAEIFHATPIEVLDADASDAALGAAIRRALGAEPDPETALESHRRELRGLGLTLSELDSSPHASVYFDRKRLRLAGWDAKGLPVGDDLRVRANVGDEELAAAVRSLLGDTTDVIDGSVGAAFGYKLAWLAVRGADAPSVAEALELTGLEQVEWERGVERAYDGEVVFVSPRTAGWVFALHAGWLDGPPDLPALTARLATEVQYFATHRVVELHAWARADRGRVTRSFRELGETGERDESGEPTSVERDIGTPNEETVMQVAADWSIDPRTLGRVESESETGILGFLPNA